MTMKRTILALALAIAVIAIAAVAQPPGPPPHRDVLPAYLNLTVEQKTAFEAAQKELDADMKAAHDRFEQKLASVLTPEQKAKLDSFHAAMRFMHEHQPPPPPRDRQ